MSRVETARRAGSHLSGLGCQFQREAAEGLPLALTATRTLFDPETELALL